MALSLELTLLFRVPGGGTEVMREPLWLSQPPPRPRYQPSAANAGVLSAAAATVAKASKRSFIFLTLAQNTDGQVNLPPNSSGTNAAFITAITLNVSIAHAALRQISYRFQRFYRPAVTLTQQHEKLLIPTHIRDWLTVSQILRLAAPHKAIFRKAANMLWLSRAY